MSKIIYGKGDILPHLKAFPELHHPQLDALAELAVRMTPGQIMPIYQTWTETGGTHLYVVLPDKSEFHVSKTGNIIDLGSVN